MEISRLNELRPRTNWDVLDDALDLYRARFTLFAGIVAVVFVPFYLAFIGSTFSSLRRLVGFSGRSDTDAAFSALSSMLGIFAVALPLFGIAYVLFSGAIAAAVEDVLEGRDTGLGRVYRRAFTRFWPLIGVSLITGTLALIGACFLYVGALLPLTLFAFVAQAVILEGRGVGPSLSRSRDLAAGYGGKVCGLIVLLFLMIYFLAYGLSDVIQLAFLFGPKSGDQASQQMRQMVLAQMAQTLGLILVMPLPPIATTLLYYDIRVRREGLDMEAQAEFIGYPLAPDAFGGVLNPRIPRAVRSLPDLQGQEPGEPPQGVARF